MNNIIEIILSFFKTFFNTLLNLLYDIFVLILNAILFLVTHLIEFLASLMPSLEIGVDLIHRFPTPHQAICFLNWIFPVDVLVVCMTFYAGIYTSVFLIKPLLIFLKLIK